MQPGGRNMDRVRWWWSEVVFPALIWIGIGLAIWGWFVWRDQVAQQKVQGLGGVIAQAEQAIAAHRIAPSYTAQSASPDDVPKIMVGFLVNTKDHPHLENYGLAYPADAAAEGAFGGPVMVVDLGRKRPDAVNDKLPSASRAGSLSAARTVVFVRCDPIKIGTYGPLDAFATACDALAFDRGAPGGPQIVSTFHVEVSPPAKVLRSNHWFKVVAERPNQLIADWIKARLGLGRGG